MKLKMRGLKEILYVVSDDHGGLEKVINSQFRFLWPGEQKDRALIAARLIDVWNAPNRGQSMIRREQLVEKWAVSYPPIAKKL